jgi:hypothetical protein
MYPHGTIVSHGAAIYFSSRNREGMLRRLINEGERDEARVRDYRGPSAFRRGNYYVMRNPV